MTKPSTPTSRPSTGSSSSSSSSSITENIRVILRVRPPIPSDGGSGEGCSGSGTESRETSPRISTAGSSTFITPESDHSSFDSCVSSFSPSGQCTYAKDHGAEQKNFKFNSCAGPDATQEDLYVGDVKDIVTGVLDGYHGTVIAYGQTGSGKTHTMTGTGSPGNSGVIPRALADMFNAAEESEDDVTFGISYLQIYCEVIYDMLSPNTSTNLSIREKNEQL